jgi:hypothetical protein
MVTPKVQQMFDPGGTNGYYIDSPRIQASFMDN